MVAQDRRGGSGSWIPGLLATFWVLLAGISGAYLYYVVTDPNARLERALASPVAAPEAQAPKEQAAAAALSAEEAEALTDAIEAKDKEISKLKSEIHQLSTQVAAFDGRLKPIEKVLGPVAALPRSTSVTTSPPEAQAPEENPAAAGATATSAPAVEPSPKPDTTPAQPAEAPPAATPAPAPSP